MREQVFDHVKYITVRHIATHISKRPKPLLSKTGKNTKGRIKTMLPHAVV